MKIAELITLAENKLADLNREVATATAKGDAGALAELSSEVSDTEATLMALKGGAAAE